MHRYRLYPVLALIIGIFCLGYSAPATAQSSSPHAGLQQFSPVSKTEGWLLLNDHLYWTTDGGNQWSAISPSINNSTIQTVFFRDTLHGWAILSAGNGLMLATTSDTGHSWQSQPLNLFSANDPRAVASAYYLQFTDLKTGWLVVKQGTSSNFRIGTLFGTTDGGQTWMQRDLPIGEPVFFLDAKTGWVAGGADGKAIYKTLDGGVSWQMQNVGTTPASRYFQLPTFVNAQKGFLPVIASEGGALRLEIYTTENAGQTWTQSNLVALNGMFSPDIKTPLAFIAPRNSVLIALPGTSVAELKSDNPNALNPGINAPTNVTAMSFTSEGFGFAKSVSSGCVQSACTTTTTLLRTTDGGQTWTLVKLPESVDSNTTIRIDGLAVGSGQGFDKCEVPTASQLQTWWNSSPYTSVNLYIGGSMRSCANSALNSSFVAQLSQQGWKFIPTWVGPQGGGNGCCSSIINDDPTIAYNQGVSEANAAADVMVNLGLNSAVIYYDLENYNTGNSTYRTAAKSFISGWSAQVRARGHKAGVYGSSCGSQIVDFAFIAHVPDAVWPAHWIYSSYNSNASVYGVACLGDGYWVGHSRIRQYAGGHPEQWGGVTLNIDSNAVDGPVATTTMPLAPANVNLVTNGDFNNGTNGWYFDGNGAHAIYNDSNWGYYGNFLAFKTNASTQDVYRINQNPPYSSAAGQVYELNLMLGNSSNVTKTFRLHIRGYPTPDWANAAICEVSIPSGTKLRPYQIIGKLPAWSNFGLQFEIWPADGIPDGLLDRVELFYRPGLTVPGGTNQTCIDATSTPIWTFDTSPKGWFVVSAMTNPTLTSNVLYYTITGNDPYLYGPHMLGVSAASNGWLYIEMSSNVDSSGQIFFRRTSDMNFAESRSVQFSIIPDGQMHGYWINMTSSANWNGTIEEFRLDPAGSQGGGNTIGLKQIRLSSSPATSTPTSTATATRTPTATATNTGSFTPTNTPVSPRPDTIGTYKDNVFYLRATNNTGAADFTVDMSTLLGVTSGDLPVAGDWNGDGIDTVGVYRSSTGFFFLSDSNVVPSVAYTVLLGNPADTPFAGKWRADMAGDGIGVFRPSNGILYQKRQLTSGFSDYFAVFGNPGDIGFAGDWDANGLDSIGVYRPSNTTWYMTNNSEPSGITFGDISFVWDIGGNVPVVGDWNGDTISTVGYRAGTIFVLHSTLAPAGSDIVFAFESSGQLPIAGKWVSSASPNPNVVIRNSGNGFTDSIGSESGD